MLHFQLKSLFSRFPSNGLRRRGGFVWDTSSYRSHNFLVLQLILFDPTGYAYTFSSSIHIFYLFYV